jgi:hypothetical protein
MVTWHSSLVVITHPAFACMAGFGVDFPVEYCCVALFDADFHPEIAHMGLHGNV